MLGAAVFVICAVVLALSIPFAGMMIDGAIGLARLLQRWRAR